MKILITGGNGLLGQKLIGLITATQKSGDSLIATSKGGNRNLEQEGYEYCSLDITDKANILKVLGKYQPDVVINTAAMTNVDQCETEKEGCWAINVKAVEYLIEGCQKNECKLIHLSTDFIFDGLAGPYLEDAEPSPVNYYGESKLAGEQLILNSDIEWAIARTILVYGVAEDMSRSNIILWVKKSLEDGKQIKVVTDQWRTPTLAEDLAKGCYLIAHKNASGIFNISSDELLTPYDMAIKTATSFGLNKELIEKADSSTFTQTAKRPAKTGFIIDKAQNILGFQPHTFDEGIEILKSQLATLGRNN